MNVEIGAEAVLFPEKEYINGIAVAVHIFRQGGQHVVQLRSFVDNVAQSETTLHEDKPRHWASLPKNGSFMSLGGMKPETLHTLEP
jgi:hypothetical protein